jgi:hypothetical protein
MSDETLTALAIAIELGVPFAAAFLYWRRPVLRSKLIVVLAALTPALIFYAAVSVAFALDPINPSNRFAFYAGWFMTLGAYIAILAIGIGLSFLPKPTHLFWRYLLGLSPGAILAYVLR